MAFMPCNLTLSRLIEIHAERRERGRAGRQQAVDGRRMSPGTSDYIDRYEAAVDQALKKLRAIEISHPELLEAPQK
jgi:hypothetical protein